MEGVNVGYAAKITSVNAATLASLAWAPSPPTNVLIGGAVRPSTTLSWDPVASPDLAGYKIYRRETTEPQWKYSRFVGNVTEFTLENVIIDNYLFGVASVGKDGNESDVAFPSGQRPRRSSVIGHQPEVKDRPRRPRRLMTDFKLLFFARYSLAY